MQRSWRDGNAISAKLNGLVEGILPYPPTPDDIRKAVQDQLGLQLTPAEDSEQLEFLVAEKQP